MASAKRYGFHQKERIPLKGMVSHCGQWFRQSQIPPKGMVSTTGTSFHSNQWFSVKGMDCTKRNGFR